VIKLKWGLGGSHNGPNTSNIRIPQDILNGTCIVLQNVLRGSLRGSLRGILDGSLHGVLHGILDGSFMSNFRNPDQLGGGSLRGSLGGSLKYDTSTSYVLKLSGPYFFLNLIY